MRPQHLFLRSAFTCLALLALACSSHSDDTEGQDEGATVIEPNGTDQPGRFTVVAPATTALEPTQFEFRGTYYPLAKVVDSVSSGGDQVVLTSKGSTYSFSTSQGIAIHAGQTTTVNAALLAVDARPATRTVGLGTDAINHDEIYLDAGRVALAADGTRYGALLGGRYEIRWGMLDGTSVDLSEGSILVARLADAKDRRVARIEAPAARDFPTASCKDFPDADTYRITAAVFAGEGRQREAFVRLQLGETIDVGLGPRFAERKYALETSAWSGARDLPAGTAGGPPAVTKLGRVDIDDVLINGSQPRVKGSYQIYAADAQGARQGSAVLRCEPPTKTGVDLLPGRYRIEVSYDTVEAGRKVDVHVVDVN